VAGLVTQQLVRAAPLAPLLGVLQLARDGRAEPVEWSRLT